MAKFKDVAHGYWEFTCPGCGRDHYINTNPGMGAVWDFNGDLDNPTVSPSLLVNKGGLNPTDVCHSFIREGKIQFLNDCTHALAGQTVELPEV